MTLRRGEKETDPAELKARERTQRLAAVQRLREHPDFWVLKTFLEEAKRTRMIALGKVIITAQDQARHNFDAGFSAGIDFALRGAEIIESVSTEPPTASKENS